MDLAEFDEKVRGRTGIGYKLDRILDDLDPARRDALLAALSDRKYSDAVVAAVVTGWGHAVSDSAVRKWRISPTTRSHDRH